MKKQIVLRLLGLSVTASIMFAYGGQILADEVAGLDEPVDVTV